MKKKSTKVLIYTFFTVFILSFWLNNKQICYAKGEEKINIGEEASGTVPYEDSKVYTFTLKSKMKIKFSIEVKEKTDAEDEDYYYDEDPSIFFDLDDDNLSSYVEDLIVKAGKPKTKTITLNAGTYKIRLFGCDERGLDVTIKTENVSIYTKKISISDQLNLLKGDSKTLTVKSEESGKLPGDVTWSSSDKKVATVDSSGKVKGIKPGTCVISAKTKNSKTVKCKVTIKERPQLYIIGASFDINFLEGVEPYIAFQNNFGKTIKYVYFECYFYNTVGDPAYCSIQGTNHQTLQITGPIKDGVMDSYYWDAVIYNSSTGKMYLKSAKVVFMDGTSKTVSIKKSYK